MKTILLTLVISFSTLFNCFSQTIEGTYSNIWTSPSGESLSYELTLNEDGTFKFTSTQSYLSSDVTTMHAEGTWKIQNYLLVLNTEGNSDAKELASRLNNSKARYVSVSPRNPNFNLMKPSLKFYKSDVFFAKEMALQKDDTTITSSN